MDWLRWHHGTATDPKWRLVAADSGQPVHAVLAVWSTMLECASQSEDRGRLLGWNDRVVAVALDLTAEQVTGIYAAMQGLVLDGDRLSGWNRRQPKREREDNSTDRVRAHRERAASETPDGHDVTHETPRNATERPDKRRVEESREEEETRGSAPPSAMWFEGRAFRLNRQDFEAWEQRFSDAYPDFWDELWRIDGKLAAEGLPAGKAFLKAEGWLNAGLTRWRKQRDPPAAERAKAEATH